MMVVIQREIAPSIRDKMNMYDSRQDRHKWVQSDACRPGPLVQTKSPMVQRRSAAGRFARRGSGRARPDDESRIPLRRTAASSRAGGGATGSPRPVQQGLPSDDLDQPTGSEDEQDVGSERRLPAVSLTSCAGPAADDPSPAAADSRSSFLDNRTKVTGIRDVLTRMDASNTEAASPDNEARSLLNKFLGAQVMMTGMESMMAQSSGAKTEPLVGSERPSSVNTRSQRWQFRTSRDEDGQWKSQTASSSAVTKSRAAADATVVAGVNIAEVTDQDKLHEMLEQCDNFDERKKIRARLMTLMQEAKARREQASRRRQEHQQRRDGGTVRPDEAQMINDWLADNFDSDGKDTTSETKMASSSTSVTAQSSSSKPAAGSQRPQSARGKAPVSAFDKFKQLDSANPRSMPRSDSTASDGSGGFKLDSGLAAKAQGAKEMTLYWCQCRTREYENVNIENFSTSWNDGMAFCALIHHFYPDAFDFNKLNPKNRRYNFDLAFKTADEKAGIFPLLDTDDMVAMKKPDWKCVFTYVQAIYRRLKDGP